jgi:beta-glucosidase
MTHAEVESRARPRSRGTRVSSAPDRLGVLRAPEAFLWATGIEDTFIADPWPATGRTLDEYELTGHYRQWRADLARMAELGVRHARYGIPWYRVHPRRGRWSWQWADGPLERLLALGIEPIVDLVHYGTPRWLDGGFLDPDFPEHMAEYAARVAQRFRGAIRWYTPLNEPRIAAWYAGRLGWWPPYRRSWRGFVAILMALCRGIALTDRALRAVDGAIVPVHVDASDWYRALDPAAAPIARHRQSLVFLALDVLTGRVTPRHPLFRWLLAHGASTRALAEHAERPIPLEIVGVNLYPMFTNKRVLVRNGVVHIRNARAGGELVERVLAMYARRYGCPVMITETASWGTPARRIAWLAASVAAVRRLRARGVPVVGYTWWPMLALVAWSYRQGRRAIETSVLQMGLWDLDCGAGRRRVRTAVVDAFARTVAQGAQLVGRIGMPARGG